MPIMAVRLSCFSSSSAVAEKDIVFVGEQPKVVGIATPFNVTNMIDDGNIVAFTTWNRPDIQSVHQAVNSMSNFVNSDFAVSAGRQTSCPQPAVRVAVNYDLREKQCDLPFIEDGVIISVSHSMPPNQVSFRSELGQVDACSSSLIIPQSSSVCKLNNQWPKAVRPLSWLLERFAPVPGWTEQDLEKLVG